MAKSECELGTLREQLQALGVETVVSYRLAQTILDADQSTLYRWRKKGLIPDPPVRNRYPLSWLLDLMAAKSPRNPGAVNHGARLTLHLAREELRRFSKIEKLTGMGRPLVLALERGDLEPDSHHLTAIQTGLGVTLIDLYRLGRVAHIIGALRG